MQNTTPEVAVTRDGARTEDNVKDLSLTSKANTYNRK